MSSTSQPTWWQRLLKWEPGISLAQWFLDRVTNNWPAIAGISAGSGMAWLTAVTEIFDRYAPVSWGVAFIATVFVFYIGRALHVYAKRQAQIAEFQRKAIETSSINPLEDAFQKKRIRLPELSPPIGFVVESKNFIDCDLIGPASLLFENCTFNNNTGRLVDGAIMSIGSTPLNVLHFKNCNFSRCRFFLVTFLVPEASYYQFMAHGWTGLNWVTQTPQGGWFSDLGDGQLPLTSIPPKDEQTGTQ